MIIGFVVVILFGVAFHQARLSAEETQSGDMRLCPPTTIEWKAGPAALPPGARMAVLEGDPTKEGPFVVRFQFPDGYHVPPHTHPKTERVTVISGTLYLATGEALDRTNAKKLPAGSFGPGTCDCSSRAISRLEAAGADGFGSGLIGDSAMGGAERLLIAS